MFSFFFSIYFLNLGIVILVEYLREKISRIRWDKIFSHDTLSLRKSKLKICEVYFNLAKYSLGMSKQSIEGYYTCENKSKIQN